jgi:hypothetical protein
LQKGDLQPGIAFFTSVRIIFPFPTLSFRPKRSEASAAEEPASFAVSESFIAPASREAAQECSPWRKPWVGQAGNEISP